MFPGFNSFPRHPNQVPANPSARQVVSSNPSNGGAPDMLPNVMPVQPQLGISPQNVMALNSLLNQLGNAPNHLLALQSNQFAMQQLMGFSSLNNAPNLNAVPGQVFNMGQTLSPLGLFQPVGGNMVMPTLQFGTPNPMQNVNHLLSMQTPNISQIHHRNGPPFPNPVMGPDGSRQQLNQSQQNLSFPAMGSNGIGTSAVTSQQLEENHAAAVNRHSDQANKSQESRRANGGSTSNSNFRNFSKNEFTRNPNTQGRFKKPHFQHQQNRNRRFDYSSGGTKAGVGNMKAQKSGLLHPADQTNEKKRASIIYTEQEIKQWREERRKNHPSSSSAKKKQMEAKMSETDAKARSEQLKEILARQAELGVEVAEIPSHYLGESENKIPGRDETTRPFTKKDRFHNKHDKKRKRSQRDRFTRSNRSRDTVSAKAPPPSLKQSEPTLLRKLLSRDIRRDKLRLLQVFRFMVINDFFKDGLEGPLKYPLVIIAENGTEGSIFEEKSSVSEVNFGDGADEITHNLDCSAGVNDCSGSDDSDDSKGGNGYQNGNDGFGVHQDEEEGEITD